MDIKDLDLSYTEMSSFKAYGDRLKYLSLRDKGYISPRQFSNPFYKSPVWLSLRDEVIARDGGYDLGVRGVKIEGPLYVHHMIPITPEDIQEWNEDIILNPDRLITCSHDTHMAIHYGLIGYEDPVERKPNDTNLW